MSLENAVNRQIAGLEEIGRAGLNVKYPDEFEVYVCAFELVDQLGRTLRYFIFPVMPSSIDETQPRITNIKKTLAGVTVLSTPTFVPVDINMTGNFGRRFRVLLGTDAQDFIQSFVSDETGKVTQDSFINGTKELFDSRVKTGYGCLKILEDIMREADRIDDNGPRRLIFYNLAFGNSYVVKPMAFKISQTQDVNMVHQYQLSLKAIAPIEALRSQRELTAASERLNATSYVQKKVDRTINNLIAFAPPLPQR